MIVSVPMPATDLQLADGRALVFLGRLDRGPFPPQHVWRTRVGMTVIASQDETPHGRLLHVSLSYRGRDPTWAEIKAVRELFFPADVDVMMVLARQGYYVNLHEHCFHLWQMPVPWGVM